MENKQKKRNRGLDMRRKTSGTFRFSPRKKSPRLAPLQLPASPEALEALRLEIDKKIATQQERLAQMREQLFLRRHQHEALQQEILYLLEQRAEQKKHYLGLHSIVATRIREYKKKVARGAAMLAQKKKDAHDREAIVWGLRARGVRNALQLWHIRQEEYRQVLHAAVMRRKRIEQEIRILLAQQQGLTKKMQRLAQEDHVPALPRRRGKIIAARDLSLLERHFAAYSQQKNQPIVATKKVPKKKTTLEHSSLRAKREEYRIAILEKKQEILNFSTRIRELRIRVEQLNAERTELAILKEDLAKKIENEKAQKEMRWKAPSFDFSLQKLSASIKKQGVVFAIFALVFTAPIGVLGYIGKGMAVKGKVLGESTQAVGALMQAGESIQQSQFDSAKSQFESAAATFRDALNATNSLGEEIVAASRVLPQTTVLDSGKKALVAANNLSEAGAELTNALTLLSGTSVHVAPLAEKQQKENQEALKNIVPNTHLTDALVQAKPYFVAADEKIQKATEAMNTLNASSFPAEYREKITTVQSLLPRVATAYHMGVSSLDALLEIAGANGKRRYLLVFQNNTELRGTGGFIGSYGVADFDHGAVTNIKINGIYDPDGQLTTSVYPPTPLRMIAPKWFTRDANWYPDFPTAARDIERLYEKTGGSSVDGVIALTPTVLERLLAVTGPVEVPEEKVTVTAENFISLTEFKTEIDYDKEENKPKQFLSDMMPHILQKLFQLPREKWLDVAGAIQNAVTEKHILAFFFDDKVEQRIIAAGVGGEMKNAPLDFLSIVNTNIKGQKTDTLIQEKIQHAVQIEKSGVVRENVTVTRTHTGDNRWPSGQNRDYIRVYVPKGAVLVDATGFEDLPETHSLYPCNTCAQDPEIAASEKTFQQDAARNIAVGEELGKTVFAGWQVLDPGATKTYQVTYTLPMKISLNIFHQATTYSLYAQKQSGSIGSDYTLEITLPNGYDYAKISPVAERAVVSVKKGSALQFATMLNQDRFLAAVITK